MSVNLLKTIVFWCLSVLWLSFMVQCESDPWINNDGDAGPLSKTCMRCICKYVGCRPTRQSCSEDKCGIFKISYDYWRDSYGMPKNNAINDEQRFEYEQCTKNEWCSARTVQHYMRRYLPDCVREVYRTSRRRAPCETALILHLRGPEMCSEKLDEDHRNNLHECLRDEVWAWIRPS